MSLSHTQKLDSLSNANDELSKSIIKFPEKLNLNMASPKKNSLHMPAVNLRHGNNPNGITAAGFMLDQSESFIFNHSSQDSDAESMATNHKNNGGARFGGAHNKSKYSA